MTEFWMFVAIALSGVIWLIAFLAYGEQARRVRRLEKRVERAELFLPLFDVQRCRECRCTDEVACASGCWWVEEDLCSSCSDDRASSLEGSRE